MNTTYLTHVRELFANYYASPETIRNYQRQWIRSVRVLGDKWLYAKHVNKLGN